jgi:hypothetical protein
MLQKSLKQGLGNWVDGDRFFDREREMALFRDYLLDRTSLLLVAPRRIGKTSFMREAGRQLGDEIIALHVDLQQAASAEEAIVELGLACRPHTSIWSKAAGAFGELLAKLETIKVSDLSVSLRSSLNSDNWQQKGDELMNVLAGAASTAKRPVVIFLDEVPILVNRILKSSDSDVADRKQAADRFMSWLRDNALRHKNNIVLVVTGSIGLEPVLRSAGLSGTLNAFHPFELAPWKDDIAKACLLALASEKKFPLADAVAEYMVQKLGCSIPHHVQMYFDHVRTTYIVEDREGPVTTEMAEEVYQGKMTGLRGHADLMHMEERLRLVLPDSLFDLALTLLTQTAVVGRLTAQASTVIASDLKAQRGELLDTLAILEHDGYLRGEGDDRVYISHLVRDWWRKRFGHGYTPVK